MRSSYKVCFVALVFILATCQAGYSQTSDDGARSISTPHFRNLLRQPGGIQKVAALIGSFSFKEPSERWGESNLRFLKTSSSIVVRGVVQTADPTLSPDGDQVETVYTIRIDEALKGSPPGEVKVTCEGGKLTLPDGHTVTMHTTISDNLQVGQTYVLFLVRQDDSFTLLGGIQTVFHVSPDTHTVHLLDQDPDRNRELRYLDGASLSTLEQEYATVPAK